MLDETTANGKSPDTVRPVDLLFKGSCLLCGGKPFTGGIFIADDQTRVLAPPGRIRTVGYTLCSRCARKKNSRRRVEERIFKQFAEAG